MTRRIALVAVATALAVTLLPAAATAADRVAIRPGLSLTTDYEDAVRMLEPYVTTAPDGSISIDAPPEVRSAIDPLVLSRLEASAAVAPAVGDLAAPLDQTALDTHCLGRSGFSTRWWGWRYYMNSCQTARLVSLLSLGGASAGLFCAAFGLAGFACAAFAGALGILGESIKYIQGARYGIRISACWVCLPVVRRQ